MPPCAHCVEPALRTSLVTTRTSPDLVLEPQRRGQPGDAGADDHDVARGASSPVGCRRRRSSAGRWGQPTAVRRRPDGVVGRATAAEHQGQVVDEAGGADPGGDQDAGLGARGWRRRAARRGPGSVIDEVVEVDAGRAAQLGARGGLGGAPARRRRPRLGGAQRAAQRGRRTPLLGVEVAVAARQRQAVGLADGLAADHLDPEAQVRAHPADQRELLVVLLAEHRHVGPHQPEQLGDHRQHAARSGRAGTRPRGSWPAGRGRR